MKKLKVKIFTFDGFSTSHDRLVSFVNDNHILKEDIVQITECFQVEGEYSDFTLFYYSK